jgi:hypothetical protein
MLRPSKHSHPDRTILNVAFVLLARLRKQRLDTYDDLRDYVKKRVDGGDILFLPALNLLYLLGLVEYRPKTDGLEYVGPK